MFENVEALYIFASLKLMNFQGRFHEPVTTALLSGAGPLTTTLRTAAVDDNNTNTRR